MGYIQKTVPLEVFMADYIITVGCENVIHKKMANFTYVANFAFLFFFFFFFSFFFLKKSFYSSEMYSSHQTLVLTTLQDYCELKHLL